MKFDRRYLVPLICLLSGCGATEQSSDKSSGEGEKIKRPNVIFILADDLGYGDVGAYGQKMLETPNIDRLAHDGMKFTNFYAGNAVCAPSRCSLLTGKHPGHASIRGNHWTDSIGVVPLLQDDITIAEALDNTPYITGISGRWHLGGEKSNQKPLDNGFDYHFGKLSSLHPNKYGVLIDDLFDENGRHIAEGQYAELGLEPMYEYGSYYNLEPPFQNNRPVNMDEMITEKAIDFIESNKRTPFFLYVAYSLVHSPLEFMEKAAMDHPDWPKEAQIYASMLKYLDHLTGQIVNAVDSNGLAENTVIIFASDNGPHEEGGNDPYFFDSNGTLRGIKRDLYEGGIREPMIARWTGTIAPGSISDHIGAFWDILPTVCELAGTTIPEGTDGMSFAPLLLGEEQKPHDYLYWEFDENGYKQAIRKGPWKAIHFIDENKIELYNLDLDLGEQTNLAADNPEKVKELLGLMKIAHIESELFPLLKEERGR